MTPGARVAAAIELLDDWLAGAPAEKLLTRWGRANRFAGSRDRVAIRDHVFDAIRCRRSYAALGGAETGRGLMIGAMRAAGRDLGEVFSGEGHAPAPLKRKERHAAPALADLPEAERLDCPDWLVPMLRAGLGPGFAPVMEALRHRAPVFLRVNLARSTVKTALAALSAEGIEARAHPLAHTAIEVTRGARRVQTSVAYRNGLVELQDAASQAVVELIGARAGDHALDYCAGGGGKTLALAAKGVRVSAHDIDPRRMRDLPERARRSGVKVERLTTADVGDSGPYDIVFADAPCSGSGAWRRSPEGKWRLNPKRLRELLAVQAGILDKIAPLTAEGGKLAYATCSLLDAENGGQVQAFLARTPGWRLAAERRFTPLDGGDGFYVAVLTRYPQAGLTTES